MPASGRCTPPRMLMSVDLPAPFSPRSAWISPRRSENVTPSRAWTPPNRLLMPCRARIGWSRTSSSVMESKALQEFLGVLLRDELHRDLDVLGHLLAVEVVVERLRRDLADLPRELGGAGMELPRLDRRDALARA